MRCRQVARLGVAVLLIGGVGPARSAEAARPSQPGPARLAKATATPDPRTVSVRFAQVASGLQQPTALASSHDGTGRLFTVERRGVIRFYRPGHSGLSSSYLHIGSRVYDGGGEQGLLGLAFHPKFKSNGFFYVSYTKSNGTLRVARFHVANYRQNHVDPATEVAIIEIAHPGATNHNGGQLAFNRDSYLYISTGDGGGGGDSNDNAQNRARLLGKILRIYVDRRCGGRRYCSPPSNPYFGHPTFRPEIWAYGLRNPWKFSFDRASGYQFIGDVGQGRREEVDRIPYLAGGHNLGWNCYEGSLRYPGGRCLSGVTYRFPVHEYGRGQGSTIIGGYVSRSTSYRTLAGIYIYADFGSGRVWGLRSGVNAQIGSFPGSPTSFGETEAGNLYAVGYDGRLFRVIGSPR